MGFLLFFVVLPILSLILYAVASNSESKEKAAESARIKNISSMLKEEFPDFSDVITYAKCDLATSKYESLYGSKEIQSLLTPFMKEYKSKEDENKFYAVYANSISSIFSDDFAKFAAQDSEKFYNTLKMVFEASKRAA